jgi:hypothetical protein
VYAVHTSAVGVYDIAILTVYDCCRAEYVNNTCHVVVSRVQRHSMTWLQNSPFIEFPVSCDRWRAAVGGLDHSTNRNIPFTYDEVITGTLRGG